MLGGSRQIADITTGYDGLARRGVKVVHDTAVSVDSERRIVRLAGGSELRYDRLILSPGIDFLYKMVPGLDNPEAQTKVLHAWKAGPQTVALRQQLHGHARWRRLRDFHPARAPYRCPPGTLRARLSGRVVISSAPNPGPRCWFWTATRTVVSKKAPFTKAWNEEYKGIVEYRPTTSSPTSTCAH